MSFPLSTLSTRQPGFSIAEVMLAGFVLTTGMVAIMSLFSVVHSSAVDTRSLIIAAGLAQEGVEIARNIRDNNFAYRTENWTTGCSTSTSGDCDPFNHFPSGANRRCAADYDSVGDTAFDCSSPTYALSLNGVGLYHHGSGTPTRFYRLLRLDFVPSAPSGNMVRVQSFVTWQNISNLPNNNNATSWCTPFNRCVYTELLLYPWQ